MQSEPIGSIRQPGAMSGPPDGAAAGWSGVIAGAAYLCAQVALVTFVRHDSPWVPLQRISAFLLGPEVVPPPAEMSISIAGFALMIHFTLAFVYGRLIALAVRRVRPSFGWIAGAGGGLAVYVVNFHVIAPLFFRWFVDSQGPVTLLDHVLFGIVAASAFIALRRRAALPTGAP